MSAAVRKRFNHDGGLSPLPVRASRQRGCVIALHDDLAIPRDVRQVVSKRRCLVHVTVGQGHWEPAKRERVTAYVTVPLGRGSGREWALEGAHTVSGHLR